MFNQHGCFRQRAVRPAMQTDVCGSCHWSFLSNTKSVKKYKTWIKAYPIYSLGSPINQNSAWTPTPILMEILQYSFLIIPTYTYLINVHKETLRILTTNRSPTTPSNLRRTFMTVHITRFNTENSTTCPPEVITFLFKKTQL